MLTTCKSYRVLQGSVLSSVTRKGNQTLYVATIHLFIVITSGLITTNRVKYMDEQLHTVNTHLVERYTAEINSEKYRNRRIYKF